MLKSVLSMNSSIQFRSKKNPTTVNCSFIDDIRACRKNNDILWNIDQSYKFKQRVNFNNIYSIFTPKQKNEKYLWLEPISHVRKECVAILKTNAHRLRVGLNTHVLWEMHTQSK